MFVSIGQKLLVTVDVFLFWTLYIYMFVYSFCYLHFLHTHIISILISFNIYLPYVIQYIHLFTYHSNLSIMYCFSEIRSLCRCQVTKWRRGTTTYPRSIVFHWKEQIWRCYFSADLWNIWPMYRWFIDSPMQDGDFAWFCIVMSIYWMI